MVNQSPSELYRSLREKYGIEIVTKMKENLNMLDRLERKTLCHSFYNAINKIEAELGLVHQLFHRDIFPWYIFPELDRHSQFLRPFRPHPKAAYYWPLDHTHIRHQVLESLLTKLQNENKSV